MVYMKFMSLAMGLIDKASDGDLTLSEITDCLENTFPEYWDDVHNAVVEAMKDGRIDVWEVMKITTAIVA